MLSRQEWIKWGRLNQSNPDENPLFPERSLQESVSGLNEIIPQKIKTKIPRLPWGSQKALIVTLSTDTHPLETTIDERDSVHKILSIAGFDVNSIDAREKENPNILRQKLASNHWDIIHFIGHMNSKENQIGLSGKLSAADFVASCCRSAPPRLVVLNACRSGDTSAETEVAGISGPIAEQFCLRGVDAVIATRWDIWDKAATQFSRYFWEHIVGTVNSFGLEDELRLDVKEALLKTRVKLKETFPLTVL